MTRRLFAPASILFALAATAVALNANAAPQGDADAARAALPSAVLDLNDPVTLSFGRLLAHTPNTIAPKVPAGSGEDPLLTGMVWTLHGMQVAKTAAPAPQALLR